MSRSWPSIEVRTSPIHGRGVFASKRLRAGQYIATFEGRRTDRGGSHVLWTEIDGKLQGVRGTGQLRFLNHASDANAELAGLDLYALRNIQPHAEITLHYGDDWDETD